MVIEKNFQIELKFVQNKYPVWFLDLLWKVI